MEFGLGVCVWTFICKGSGVWFVFESSIEHNDIVSFLSECSSILSMNFWIFILTCCLP